MKNASVREVGIPEQGELTSSLIRGAIPIFRRLGQYPSLARELSAKPELWTKALELLLPKRMEIPGLEVERWQKYYRDVFGITASFAGMQVPVEDKFPTWLIVMHDEVSNSCNRIMDACGNGKHYKSWQYATDLDASVTRHDRSGTYAVRIAASQEAEYGFVDGKNLSSQDVWDRGLIMTTLPERLIAGDIFFLEKKDHLDKTVITLCPGSRYSDGDVPSVRRHLDGGEVRVGVWNPQDADGNLRFRSVIL